MLQKPRITLALVSTVLALFSSLSSCSQADTLKGEARPVMLEERIELGSGPYPFPVMTVKVEGVTANLIVDTTESSISLHVEFFDKLKAMGLVQTESHDAIGGARADQAGATKVRVEFGSQEAFTLQTSLILQSREFPGGSNLDGSLGPSVFGLFGCAEANFKDRTVTAYALKEGADCPIQVPTNALQFKFLAGTAAKFPGTGQELNVLLDTSAPTSTFETKYAKAAKNRYAAIQISTPTGLREGFGAGPVRIEFGNSTSEIETATFTDEIFGFLGEGVIGFDVLRYSTWYFVRTEVYFVNQN